ncbi:MAG: hypothetical protein ACPGVO_09805 [Spirulinaceae cyanobacterium]
MTQFNNFTEKLIEFDENQLMLHLGMITQSISEELEGRTRSVSIDSIDLTPIAVTRSNKDTLNFGQRVFKRLNAASYELLCKDPFDDGETLQEFSKLLEDSTEKAARFLAPVLVAHLGLAPTVAGIITVLIVKTISKAIADEICATWEQSLGAPLISTPEA